MGDKQMDPRQQFSKKLAGRTEWFWFIYLVLLIALVAYRPEVATVIVYLAILVSIVMIVSVLAYTRNSLYEKGLLAARDMAKLKFSWKHKGVEMVTQDNVVEDKEPDEDSTVDDDEAKSDESDGDNG